MSDTPASEPFEIRRWRAGEPLRDDTDRLAVEEPLEVRVRGKSLAVTMRTPGHDDELAAGFLLSEGIVRSKNDVARIDPCERVVDGNIINVFLSPDVEFDAEGLTRHFYVSSSCGLCGRASIDAVHNRFEPIAPGDFAVSAEVLQALPDTLRGAQSTFDQTGGLHAAALFDARGELLVVREDVGRHNAVDKALGWALLNDRLPLDRAGLLVSGRASFEIMQKALAAQVPLVAAVSAPSSLAVHFARDSGQTLVGFLREGRMNLYSHGERVVPCR